MTTPFIERIQKPLSARQKLRAAVRVVLNGGKRPQIATMSDELREARKGLNKIGCGETLKLDLKNRRLLGLSYTEATDEVAAWDQAAEKHFTGPTGYPLCTRPVCECFPRLEHWSINKISRLTGQL